MLIHMEGEAMPRRPAAHAEAMREQILEGGRRAFIAGGFRGTSVPSIAAEAGVSVGLIYRYFPSKEELFLELCISGTPGGAGRDWPNSSPPSTTRWNA